MIIALLLFWLFVVGIQLIFILFIFSKTAFHRQPDSNYAVIAYNSSGYNSDWEDQQGVTIIVCARNELENLKELLPMLNNQNYPTFEVLVMDDRSTDGTSAYLENEISELTNVRFIRINKEHEHVTPKKYALTIAIKKALYPTVLLTDADCRPASLDWLAEMTEPLVLGPKDISIGFSPYEYNPGLLNMLIRSETLFTAIQYFSLALAGWPYMGVGRNLAYRTNLFFANKGFYTHMNVVGGDDDLFINEIATRNNIAISLNPDTFMWSKPKLTWTEWRQQKRRHLHVGRFYKTGHKVRLGLLTGSHVLSWILALLAGLSVLTHELKHYSFSSPEWLILLVSTGFFLIRIGAFWSIVGRISYRLGHTVHWSTVPFMDLLLAIYYGLAGVRTLFSRPKKRVYWR